MDLDEDNISSSFNTSSVVMHSDDLENLLLQKAKVYKPQRGVHPSVEPSELNNEDNSEDNEDNSEDNEALERPDELEDDVEAPMDKMKAEGHMQRDLEVSVDNHQERFKEKALGKLQKDLDSRENSEEINAPEFMIKNDKVEDVLETVVED